MHVQLNKGYSINLWEREVLGSIFWLHMPMDDLSVACEACSTHMDHNPVGVYVGVVFIGVFRSIAFEGMHHFLLNLQKGKASLNTGHVQI